MFNFSQPTNSIPQSNPSADLAHLQVRPTHPPVGTADHVELDSSQPVELVTASNEIGPSDNLLQTAHATIADAITNAVRNFSAVFELPVLKAFALLRDADPAALQRARAACKQANKQISLVELDKAISKALSLDRSTAQTHHGYASDVLDRLTVDGNRPVGHEGSLYAVDGDSALWVPQDFGGLVRLVSKAHDDKANCARSNDYSGVARHAILLAEDLDFFTRAPVGLACPDGFYVVDSDSVSVEPLAPRHRQRVQIDVIPNEQATPLFNSFLHETFSSDVGEEEMEQRNLVQEIAGAMMLGLMPRHQKAVLFYDPFGRAGKGTLDNILRGLVPPAFVTAVSPFRWDEEYYVVTLAGARLNVVGELPHGKPIPSAAFKSVIGGDLITGRHPATRPITFKNEAAHIFMSNHLIGTSDQSEAFFARWLIVEFPNSRLKSGLSLDPDLANRIVRNELPGIAHWALQGARRLLTNGKFSSSSAHKRLMARWRRSANSMEEFIHDCCDLVATHHMKRSEFYKNYRTWCGDVGRKPYTKSNLYELLQNNVGLHITQATLHGHDIVRGVQMKTAAAIAYAEDPNF